METEKLVANRQYYRNFKAKNPEILTTKYECEICGGSYTYFSKSNHFKRQKHQKAMEILEKILADMEGKEAQETSND